MWQDFYFCVTFKLWRIYFRLLHNVRLQVWPGRMDTKTLDRASGNSVWSNTQVGIYEQNSKLWKWTKRRENEKNIYIGEESFGETENNIQSFSFVAFIFNERQNIISVVWGNHEKIMKIVLIHWILQLDLELGYNSICWS